MANLTPVKDPLKLNDRVVRIAQTLIKPDPSTLYEALQLSQSLVTLVMKQLTEHPFIGRP